MPLATPVTHLGSGPHAPAPGLGEHTDAVLADLGLDPAELRAAGVV